MVNKIGGKIMKVLGFIFLALILVAAGVVLCKTGCTDWLFGLIK